MRCALERFLIGKYVLSLRSVVVRVLSLLVSQLEINETGIRVVSIISPHSLAAAGLTVCSFCIAVSRCAHRFLAPLL